MNFVLMLTNYTKLYQSSSILKNILNVSRISACLKSTKIIPPSTKLNPLNKVQSGTVIEQMAAKIPVRERHPYPVLSKVRTHFPRAKETKRIVTHGYDVRMQTSGGRRVLMRRILKGRYTLSH